jgi:micrococcal nuclease
LAQPSCPQCGTARLGAFRFCRACGLDFDALPPPLTPSAPATAPAEPGPPLQPETRWMPVAIDRTPSRARRYLAVGAVAILGIGAVANLTGPSSGPGVTASASQSVAAIASPASTPAPTATTAGTASFEPTGVTEVATVVRVTDGDTIVVDVDGREVRVRYIGVDSPEPDDPDPAVKALADRASEANAALVGDKEVVLERDVSETDQFDRLLRDVWVKTNDRLVLVGHELVRQGMAQVTTYPPDVRYVDLLLATQAAARQQSLGLWAPVPTAAPASTPAVVMDDEQRLISADQRTAFEGGVGEYMWSALGFDGDRLTVRWDVTAADADCRVGWRLEPDASDPISSTIRLDAGDEEADNRRYDIDFEDAEFVVSSSCVAWRMTMQTSSSSPEGGAECDDSYADVCIPPYPPDLDCGEITERNFAVTGSDPHGFDREGDGLGCEE